MKESFKEYYKPTEKEFKDLWDNCEFIFDANVLLNIYRYSSETTEEFLDVLKKVQDRVWIPHQAALEYQRNRFSVIEEQVAKCKKLEKLLEKNEIITFLTDNKRHPFVDTELIISEIKKTFKNLKGELETSRNNYPNTISKDNLRDTITEIFNGKIGDEFDKKDLANIYKKGNERYADKIPPGFEDEGKDKGENKDKTRIQKYGDCVLWSQIITHAKLEGKPIIFVTDDAKKDWWLKNKNNAIIAPHPFLIKEMRSKSNVDFYMYRSENFMERVKKYLGFDVDKSSLQEIEKVQNDIRTKHVIENLKHVHNLLKHRRINQTNWDAQQAEAQEMYEEWKEERDAEAQEMYEAWEEAQQAQAQEMYEAWEEEQQAQAQEMYEAWEEVQQAQAQEMYEAWEEAQQAEAQEMYEGRDAEMEQKSQEDVESEDLE